MNTHFEHRALVLLSGGVDSTVALWWARSRGFSCDALTFLRTRNNHGFQSKKEVDAAKEVAQKLPVRHHYVIRKLTVNEYSNPSFQMESPEVLIQYYSIAISIALKLHHVAVVGGSLSTDRPHSEQIFSGLRSLARLESGDGLRIFQPLLKMKKKAVIDLGITLGAPLNLAWPSDGTPVREQILLEMSRRHSASSLIN